MFSRCHYLLAVAALSVLAGAELPAAHGFIIFPNVDHWLTTASGTRTGNGTPATLTWSIVPDGTSVSDSSFGNLGASDLIATFDAEFGAGPGGSNLTQRPWFQYFSDALGRWGELGGATYVYEPNDDGAAAASSSPAGVLGVRGDIRIAGAFIDGDPNSADILAFNHFPADGGDMVLDTANVVEFSDPTNGFRFLRNTLMHEHGHGFGLQHVNSDTDQLLMAPAIDLDFDGPQLDEVRAIQYYFGDANEKSNGGLGNGTAARATSLGPLTPGVTTRVGADADVPDQFVGPEATDFVSIANLADADFFSFSVSQHSKLTADLTPRGGQFTQASQGATPTSFNASARSDLTLAIFDTNGTTLLDQANDTGVGGTETLVNLDLPTAGQYYARITGAQDTIQLYELALSSIAIAPADFDEDGDVDGDDLGIWDLAYGATNLGDADDDGDSDGADFLLWQQQFTGDLSPALAVSQSVPEPNAAFLLVTSIYGMLGRTRRRMA